VAVAHKHICLDCGSIEDTEELGCEGCQESAETRKNAKSHYWRVGLSEPWPGTVNTMAGEDLELALRGLIKVSSLKIKEEIDPAYERSADIVKRALVHFLANVSPRALVEHGTTEGMTGPLNRTVEASASSERETEKDEM
jgi:hypothetical protein